MAAAEISLVLPSMILLLNLVCDYIDNYNHTINFPVTHFGKRTTVRAKLVIYRPNNRDQKKNTKFYFETRV